jgi:hypothetical protein
MTADLRRLIHVFSTFDIYGDLKPMLRNYATDLVLHPNLFHISVKPNAFFSSKLTLLLYYTILLNA